MKAGAGMGCLGLLIASALCGVAAPAALAGEAFPGQGHLAAGLACYRNLDFDCARTRLERALGAFSPEADPNYLQHMRQARWRLVQIHLASDDLGRAERELRTLLLLDPDFALPPGDHPPKVHYLLEQARAKTTAHTAGAGGRTSDRTKTGSPTANEPPAPPAAPFRLSAAARLVALFGADAAAADSGAGAELRFAWRATSHISAALSLDYAHHATAAADAPLQSLALGLDARYEVALGPLGLRLGGGLGVLAMGTADRYDHWGLDLAAAVGLVWPRRGFWGLRLELEPALLITAGGRSFYLPASIAGEVRW
jgi:hypothetical protein